MCVSVRVRIYIHTYIPPPPHSISLKWPTQEDDPKPMTFFSSSRTPEVKMYSLPRAVLSVTSSASPAGSFLHPAGPPFCGANFRIFPPVVLCCFVFLLIFICSFFYFSFYLILLSLLFIQLFLLYSFILLYYSYYYYIFLPLPVFNYLFCLYLFISLFCSFVSCMLYLISFMTSFHLSYLVISYAFISFYFISSLMPISRLLLSYILHLFPTYFILSYFLQILVFPPLFPSFLISLTAFSFLPSIMSYPISLLHSHLSPIYSFLQYCHLPPPLFYKFP